MAIARSVAMSLGNQESPRSILMIGTSPTPPPPHFFFNYAPNLEKVGDILVLACVCIQYCMYGASRYRLETSCMDSSWKNNRRIFLVFPDLSPLVKLRPFDKQLMKFCKCRISKSIIARNLKRKKGKWGDAHLYRETNMDTSYMRIPNETEVC